MKQNTLVATHNVIEADRCIADLHRRPKLEMVGLGLVYGAPGLGKTTWATRTAFKNEHVYIRLDATSTVKNFAQTLLRAINTHIGLCGLAVSGTSHDLFRRSVALLATHPDTVIIVDEIDYAFKQPQLLGAIRDIVDETLAMVILVGMENAKERLLQVNRYYFDRCSQFYQFTPATIKDLGALAATVMDVPMHEDVVRYVHRITSGNLRQAINIMDSMEQLARTRGITTITMQDIQA